MWIEEILSTGRKILALSPMADMTDSPFCQIVRALGGADIVFREMVSAEALVRENGKTLEMTDFIPAERPIVQQIFGADPLTMARAAEIVMCRAKPEGIDINMGCPVYKITSNFNGCALMKDPDRAAMIIREVKRVIGSTPLSVKIRLGWSDPDEFKKFIPMIEAAGTDLITIHGRTKTQGYSGVSDWSRIGAAKKIARVPLLANGDIHRPVDVSRALCETGADGVLIARGALGNPWFFAEVRAMEEGRGARYSLGDRIQTIREHARLHVARYGERGMLMFRKHLAWYFKSQRAFSDVSNLKDLRSRLVRVGTIGELDEIISSMKIR